MTPATPILFIDHAPALGGAEHSLLLLLQHLPRDRWQPHLACVDGALAVAATQLDVEVHFLALPRLRRSPSLMADGARTSRALADIARATDAALIHSNTVRATLYATLAARLVRRPLLWHMRDFWLSENAPARPWLDDWGKGLLCKSATAVITNSQSVAQHLPCSRKINIVHNGLDLARFDPALNLQPLRLPASFQHTPIVGMVGRLRPWKGQETFLRVAASVRQTRPDVRFLIVGGDPFQVDDAYSARLLRLAEDLDLKESVAFTGQLDDVRPALAAMDVFVHPGAPEPFGLVNIEAMAMAKPVVAFAHGALPEIVVDGVTGVLLEPGDEAGMGREIAKLLEDQRQALEMGKAGRARVEQHFTIERTVQGIETVYQQLL